MLLDSILTPKFNDALRCHWYELDVSLDLKYKKSMHLVMLFLDFVSFIHENPLFADNSEYEKIKILVTVNFYCK